MKAEGDGFIKLNAVSLSLSKTGLSEYTGLDKLTLTHFLNSDFFYRASQYNPQ